MMLSLDFALFVKYHFRYLSLFFPNVSLDGDPDEVLQDDPEVRPLVRREGPQGPGDNPIKLFGP
jgi:hypothetical protein